MRAIPYFFLFAVSVSACQVPVFRYALERWTPDRFDLVLVSYSELTPEQQAAREQLEAAKARCNLQIHSEPGQHWQATFESVKGDDPPQLLLYYPGNSTTPFWQGELTADNVARIIDSPLRQTIAEDLLAGISTVWIQIDSGDESADSAAANTLSDLLTAAADRTDVPEGVLPIDHGPDAGPVDLDDVLRSGIPLKIEFTTYRASLDDPEEAVFLAMLRQVSAPSLPLAVPVFGRGRVLEGIPSEAVNADTIAGATSYLCGACSCQVKSENPGQDLLMAVDWSSHMMGNLIIEDKTLPPLSGFAEGSQSTPPPQASSPAPKPTWQTALLMTLAAVALAIIAGTALLLRREQPN